MATGSKTVIAETAPDGGPEHGLKHGTGKRRAAVAFIFVTVALDVFAMGMIAPVLPRLITDFLGGNEPRAATIFGIFGTIWAVMQFFFSPLLGSLSDRFGRRPVVLLSNFGLGIDYLVMAVSPTLGWLFAGRIVSGITSSSIPTALAYITDVTPQKSRAEAFGMVSAAFGMGFVLGPALGGILGNVNPRLPFYVAGALSLANAVYGLLVLPESLPPEKRGVFSWKRSNPIGSLALLRRHRELLGLAAVLFLSYLTQQSLQNAWVLYLDYRFQWTNRSVGLSLALVGICSAIVGAGLMKPMIRKLGERKSLLTGLGVGWIGFAIYGFARTGLGFLSGIPIMSLWGLAGPSAQGLMTRHVESNEQGQLQGAIQCIRGMTALIGPSLFTAVFAAAIRPGNTWHLPGAPFVLAAAILLVSFLLAIIVMRAKKQEPASTTV